MIAHDTSPPDLVQPDRAQPAMLIHVLDKGSFDLWLKERTPAQRAAIAAQKFRGEAHSLAIIPAANPASDACDVVAGMADTQTPTSWCLATLAEKLPAGTYRVVNKDGKAFGDSAASYPRWGDMLIGWILGQYRFDRYRSAETSSANPGRNTKDQIPPTDGPRILLTHAASAIGPALSQAAAVIWVRDLINTPAEDMGPGDIEHETEMLARRHGADFRVTRGEALEREFPCVHAVGRAASRAHAPRMIEMEWGEAKHPRVAIIGKGVSFDTGGLDLKPSSAMALMKKDMGGAAHAMALARLVMEAALPVRLHLLIPAAENAVAGNAIRPGDVLRSRAGLTIEIGNTDAEGRLLLADALARASEGCDGNMPDLILDFATLTGAARVALGPDLPAMMSRNAATAEALMTAGLAHDDPVWRLPLHETWREYLNSDIADLNNASNNGFAGASVAGLFLDRFVGEALDWAHFDTFAWRPSAKPGRPKGGDALGLRASWAYLEARYSEPPLK